MDDKPKPPLKLVLQDGTTVMMTGLKEWARRMLPEWGYTADQLLDSLATPGTVVNMLFILGQQWERRQHGHWMFRVGDRVVVKQFHPEWIRSHTMLVEGETIGDVIGNTPSYEGVIESISNFQGGALVRHDSGSLRGWMWHEIEHVNTTP